MYLGHRQRRSCIERPHTLERQLLSYPEQLPAFWRERWITTLRRPASEVMDIPPAGKEELLKASDPIELTRIRGEAGKGDYGEE